MKLKVQTQQIITLQGLTNWVKVYLITDAELIDLPAKLVAELGGHLQERWLNLNRRYYG